MQHISLSFSLSLSLTLSISAAATLSLAFPPARLQLTWYTLWCLVFLIKYSIYKRQEQKRRAAFALPSPHLGLVLALAQHWPSLLWGSVQKYDMNCLAAQRLLNADCQLPTANWRLATGDCQLVTARRWLENGNKMRKKPSKITEKMARLQRFKGKHFAHGNRQQLLANSRGTKKAAKQTLPTQRTSHTLTQVPSDNWELKIISTRNCLPIWKNESLKWIFRLPQVC